MSDINQTVAQTLASMARRQTSEDAREEERQAAQDRAFEDALRDYPIDNRRKFEGWKDTILGDSGKSKPPRVYGGGEVGFLHIDPLAPTIALLRAHFPKCRAAIKLGEKGVRAALQARLDEMEDIRRSGRAAVAKPKTSTSRKGGGWGFGGDE